jgi:predicted transcriptional regulator
MSHTIRIHGKEYREGGTIDLDTVDVRLPDGTRLTEARAQELAEEIHQRAQAGRPSLTEPGVQSPQLRFAVPAELKERLRERAETEHRTPSALAREALERYLAS